MAALVEGEETGLADWGVGLGSWWFGSVDSFWR